MSARSALALTALAVTLAACGDDDPDVTVTTAPPPGATRAAPAARTPARDDAASADNPGEDAGASTPKDDAPAGHPAAGGKPGAASVAESAAPAAAAPAGGKPAPGGSAPAGAASAGGAQTHSGTLEDGDETLDSGEFADGYTVEATAGQTITVDLTSSDFDTYVILRSPSGEQFDNDDFDGSTEHSQIVQRAGEGGTWRVVATTYEEGMGGAYRLAIRTGGR
ncbi:MAG TPA: hypothetical protein VGB53_07280 [Rubricoccaceae bacterium]